MFLLTIPLITGILVIFQQGILGQNVAYTAVFSIACFCLYDIMFSLRDGFVRLREVMRSGKGSLSGVYKIVLQAVMLVSLLFIAWQQINLLRSPILNNDILAQTLAKEPWVLASTIISAVWITWHYYRRFVREDKRSLGNIPDSHDVFSVLSSPDQPVQLPWQHERTFFGNLKEAWRRWQQESQKTLLPDRNRQFGGLRYFTLYSDELVKIYRGERSTAGLFWIYGAGVGGVFWGTVAVLFRGLSTLPSDLEQNQFFFAVIPFLIGCYIAYGLILISGLVRVSLRQPKKGMALFISSLAIIAFGLSIYLGFCSALKSYLTQCCSGVVFVFLLVQFRLANAERQSFILEEHEPTVLGEFIAPVSRFINSLLLGELPLWFVYWICRSILYVLAMWLSFPALATFNKIMGTSYAPSKFYFFFALYHTVKAASVALYLYADLAIFFTVAKYRGKFLWAWLAVIMATNNAIVQIENLVASFRYLLKNPRSMLVCTSCYFFVFLLFALYIRNAWGKYTIKTEQFHIRVRKLIVWAGALVVCKLTILNKVQLPLQYIDLAYLDSMVSCCMGMLFYVVTISPRPNQSVVNKTLCKHFGTRLSQFWNGDYSSYALFWKLGVCLLPLWNFLINTISLNVGA